MRLFFICWLFCSVQSAFGQFQKNTVFSTSANFQFGEGLRQNDAGFGLALDGAIRGTKKFQPLMEGTIDRFFGSKLLYTGTDKMYKPFVYGIRAGGRYFVSSRVSVSILYGLIRHTLYPFEIKLSPSFKANLSVYAGAGNKVVFRSFYMNSPQSAVDIQCYGFGVGYFF